MLFRSTYENDDYNLGDMIDMSNTIVNEADQTLNFIAQNIQREENRITAEMEYVPPMAPINETSRRVVESILSIVLSRAMEKITTHENWIEGMRAKTKYLISKSKRKNKELTRFYTRQIVYK